MQNTRQTKRQNTRHMTEIHIANLRGIQELHTGPVEPLTLIAGPAGSGKTTVLDGVEIYAARGRPNIIRQVLDRAGEKIMDLETGQMLPDRDALFHNRNTGSAILLGNGHQGRDLALETPGEDSPQTMLSATAGSLEVNMDLARAADPRFRMELSEDHPLQPMICRRAGAEPVTDQELATMWDQCVMENLEHQAAEMLREAINRPLASIACIGDTPQRRLIIRRKGKNDRVHLRSMGAGAVQCARLIMALQCSRNGILLLDQPENGLGETQIRILGQQLVRQALDQNTQIIAATNSAILSTIMERTCQALKKTTMLELERPN